MLGFLLADTLGRRPVLLISSLGAAGFFAALGGVLAAADAIPGPVPPPLAPWVYVFLIAAYVSPLWLMLALLVSACVTAWAHRGRHHTQPCLPAMADAL